MNTEGQRVYRNVMASMRFTMDGNGITVGEEGLNVAECVFAICLGLFHRDPQLLTDAYEYMMEMRPEDDEISLRIFNTIVDLTATEGK